MYGRVVKTVRHTLFFVVNGEGWRVCFPGGIEIKGYALMMVVVVVVVLHRKIYMIRVKSFYGSPPNFSFTESPESKPAPGGIT